MMIFKLRGIKVPFCFLIICLVLALSSCNKSSIYDSYTINGKYDIGLSIDNVYEEISYKEFQKKMTNNDSFFVFYGNRYCSACTKSIGIIDFYAKMDGVEVIYYLDSNLKDSTIDSMSILYKIDNENDPYGTPRLWYFSDGLFVDGMANHQEESDKSWGSPADRLFLSIM